MNKENITPKRKAFLKYQLKNRDKMNEYRRMWYAKNKTKKDSTRDNFKDIEPRSVGRTKKIV